jgi:hypothetical protein
MKKLSIALIAIVLMSSSCIVSYRGTMYGRVSKECPTSNVQAFFFEKGTGKSFLPRNVFKKRKRIW